ncbi:MAG: hypothetical protein ABI769_03530 [Pseudomonadota bacterium]
MTNRKTILVAVSACLALALAATSMAAKKNTPPAPPPPPPKTKICLVLPKAQLGQGTNGADVAEPVRATLTAYLGGPATELIPLTARIPIQIDAEAQQLGCEYVLYSSVAQKKGGGFGKMFAAAAPLATMAGGMGAMGGNYGAMMAGQAVAQAATSAAAQSAQQEAMEQLGGAAKTNIKKGDQVTFDYKLVKPGDAQPVVAQAIVAKAKENGEDLVSPLIEGAATAVLTAISQSAAAAAAPPK